MITTIPLWVQLLLAVPVAVFGSGRLSRVLTYDAYPPAIWVRIKWDKITHDGPWAKLVHCQWCATPWIMAICVLWFVFLAPIATWIYIAWWLFWGILALAYIASMIIVRDDPTE